MKFSKQHLVQLKPNLSSLSKYGLHSNHFYTVEEVNPSGALQLVGISGHFAPDLFDHYLSVLTKELDATPIRFMNPNNCVSLVAQNGPPLKVHDWTDADGENKHITMEFQDLNKFDENSTDIIERICMHLHDARILARNLIDAIAKSGDPIGILLKQKLIEATAETIAPANPSEAICEIKQTLNSTKAYFNLQWNKNFANGIPQEPIGKARDQHCFRIKGITVDSTEEIELLLRVIRKYVQFFNLVINDISDPLNILEGYPWRKILHEKPQK